MQYGTKLIIQLCLKNFPVYKTTSCSSGRSSVAPDGVLLPPAALAARFFRLVTGAVIRRRFVIVR